MTPWAKGSEQQKAVGWFRYVAFVTAYNRTLRGVTSNELRFLRALQISAQPIPAERMPLVMRWYRTKGKGLRGKAAPKNAPSVA